MAEDNDNEVDEENSGGPLAFPDLSVVGRGVKYVGSKAKSAGWRASQAAKGYGVNNIARGIVSGYFSTKLGQMREDQLHTLLSSGKFLADLINSDSEPVARPINLLSRFMSREQMINALDDLVTPELVEQLMAEEAPEVYKKILESPAGGKKWFWWQTRALKGKLKRMLTEEK